LAQQQLRRTSNPSVSGLIESGFAEVNRARGGFVSQGRYHHITVNSLPDPVNVG
jgi:hypothetical protein